MTIIRKGFFDSDDLEEMSVGKNLIEDSCKKCGLYKHCLSPNMPITGEGKKEIYVLCESPGEDEDAVNKQLVGRAGTLLRNRLKDRGISLDIDCYKDNATRCRSHEGGENRKPEKSEIKCCKAKIDDDIKRLKPKFIWLFGKSAIESFYMDRFSDTELKDWRGLCIPDRKTGAYVIPMYHPSYLLRNEKDPVTNGAFDRDLDFAVSCLKKQPFQHKNHLDCVFPLRSYNDVTDILEVILQEKPEWFAFDYETTGLKPYNKGHKIACISGSDNEDYAFSFLYEHTKYPWSAVQFKRITELWTKILLDPDIKKSSHNQKFEEIWGRVMFCIKQVANFLHCSMNAAHIIASQRHTNLKWQTYTNFGIDDYSKSIKKYLENTDEKGFNKVMEAPVNELLLYSAMDSLFTNWLTREQRKFFEKHPVQEKVRQFFQEGLDLFAEIQMTGINADSKYYAKNFLELTDQLKEKDKQLKAFKEYTQFQEMFHKPVDFESSTDLRKLFFDMMKLKSVKTTETGLESTDKSVVAEIDHPIAKVILEKRKIKKQRDYVGLFFREINDDGRIRPFFNLHIPVTGRSSSDSPNWQNIPKRDEEAKKITRLGIVPSKGNKILEFDYCLDGDTLIETSEGSKTIKEITKEFTHKDIFVYCYHTDKKRIGLSKVINGKRTGVLKETIKVNLDNEKYIVCTPEHKFMLRSGEYKEAKLLKEGDRLMPFYNKIVHTKKTRTNYRQISLNNGDTMLEHNIVAEDILGTKIKGSNLLVHHKDGNGMNNFLTNLEIVSRKKHMQIHSVQGWKKKPNLRSRHKWMKTPEGREWVSKRSKAGKKLPPLSQERREAVSKQHKGRKNTEETIEKMRKAKLLYWENKRKEKEFPNNHKVVSVEKVENRNVYNITVEKYHNFVTTAGVVVKNSAVEVRAAAFYTKDPVLIAYIKDPKTDMHRDTAADLFLLDPDNVTSDIRFYAKNGFVFPEFYGSYYVSTAKSLWAEVPKLKTKEGRPLIDHLRSEKITTHKAFEEHVKQVEKEYWKKFKVFKKWQEQAFMKFAESGIIDTFFGFRMGGYLGKNEIINYRFQATAFHCLLWSIIEIAKELKKNILKTKTIGQVHDNGIYDLVPEEEEEVKRIIYDISTQRLRKEFSWIIVPLEIELEITQVNESWYYKKEIKYPI